MRGIIYIIGPMTGRPHNNHPKFNRVEEYLTQEGWQVLSPARHPTFLPYEVYMCYAAIDMAACHAVYALQGWELSKGASAEHALAVCQNKQIIYEVPS